MQRDEIHNTVLTVLTLHDAGLTALQVTDVIDRLNKLSDKIDHATPNITTFSSLEEVPEDVDVVYDGDGDRYERSLRDPDRWRMVTCYGAPVPEPTPLRATSFSVVGEDSTFEGYYLCKPFK